MIKMLEELKIKFSETLNWNKARIDFVTKFIIALFTSKTVNLAEIANIFYGKAKVASNYKRLQRFFRDYNFKHIEIVKLLMAFFPFDTDKFILAIDRTNWKYGKTDINILTLAIVYKDIALPVFWKLLDNKGGGSNTDDRIEIIKDFIAAFGKNKIEYLLADREFTGKEWIKYLLKENISFVIRIKSNTLIPNSKGIERHAKKFFYGLKNKQSIVLPKIRQVLGQKVYVAGCRLTGIGFLIVITDKEPEKAVENYAKRWNIETLFGFLKTKGFNMEDTRLIITDRISKLFSLLAIAFCWSYSIGEILSTINPIKIKKHERKAVSVFKLGFRLIIKVFSQADFFGNDAKLLIEYLFKFKKSKFVLQ